jgi:hypothetical protein
MIRAAVLALALAGCSDPDTLRVHVGNLDEGPSDDLPEAVVEACDLWGLHCVDEPSQRAKDVIRLYLIPPPIAGQWRAGQTVGDVGDCARVAIAPYNDPPMIAHEIGHILLGPEHAADPRDLMHLRVGTDLTDEQLDRAAKTVRAINRQCV